ncbi:MAG: NAD(P)H-dependent oxidoreductase [Thermomicrobium sp.]
MLHFKRAIAKADALLIATPEYNWSIPGPLKNAIDRASRPLATSPLRRKLIVLMSAAPGASGTMRAQTLSAANLRSHRVLSPAEAGCLCPRGGGTLPRRTPRRPRDIRAYPATSWDVRLLNASLSPLILAEAQCPRGWDNEMVLDSQSPLWPARMITDN